MDQIAIIIPCYNEAITIGKVVKDAKENVPEATIYVYDNNSTDDTAKIAQEAGAIVRREYLQGKGNVIRRMFREIDAKCYIMIDGDDTYPLEYAGEMARLVLEENADMVVGDRLSSTYYSENKRPFHNFGNDLVRFSINHLFDCKIKDIMTGYRAFSFEFVKTFPILSKGFEIETEMTIHAVYNNLDIRNVIVQYRDRPEGSESKLSTVSDGMKVLKTIFKLYKNYKPMEFFNILSLVLALISIAFFVPVFADYIKTGLVAKFPTLITCGFVFITAILSFFAGLILSTIAAKNRIDFERSLVETSYIKKNLEK